MNNLPKLISESSEQHKRVLQHLREYLKTNVLLETEMKKRLGEELRSQKGKIDGLQDFYQLTQIFSRNTQMSSAAMAALSRVREVHDFSIEEITLNLEKDSNQKNTKSKKVL